MQPLTTAPFDPSAVRREFPLLERDIRGRPLIYLDNAASGQRPRSVIERLEHYSRREHANIHRGIHLLSQEATAAYEDARETVARLIGAPSPACCLFTRGTTESVNLVASSWGGQNLKSGDEIVLSGMEHHANIVPWQLIAERTGAVIRVIPVNADGSLNCDAFRGLLTPRTRMVSIVHASNALGTLNPVCEITRLAHEAGALVFVDGAQSVPHMPVDVQEIGCDFFAFSGHKIGGPTGIGILYGKPDILNAMPPYQGGGDMIRKVSFSGTTFRPIPERFEAGTPNIEGAIGLGAAAAFLLSLDRKGAEAHEQQLLKEATGRLQAIAGLSIYGTSPSKLPVISFTLKGIHHSDIGMMLDLDGIAVRNGHHCCMPLWEAFGIDGTARASFAFYNTLDEVAQLEKSLTKIVRLIG